MSDTSPGDDVNPHLLDHLVDAGKTRAIEASEDILTAQGVKLLAKGARIAPEMRERILAHRLSKPLEQCITVVDAVSAADLARVAGELLERHPLLQQLNGVERARPAAETIGALRLSTPVRSMITVYGRPEGRLRHAVGVALIALGLARRLLPGEIERHRMLALAGLLHDVGELYIDPQLLQPSHRLADDEWRHIVSHPVVAHRVLLALEGAGREVAEAVLLHHERLSGHGYPRGVGGEALHLDGQILGAAEWLMATLESGMTPRARASVATRLIGDDFDPRIVAVLSATPADGGDAPAPADATPMVEAVARVTRIAGTLQRHQEALGWIEARRATGGPALQQMMDRGRERVQRIQAGFASVGLNAVAPEILMHQIGELGDADVQTEVLAVVHELEWRLREIERETLLHASFMPEADAAVLRELVQRLKPPRSGTTEPPSRSGTPS